MVELIFAGIFTVIGGLASVFALLMFLSAFCVLTGRGF